MRDHGEFLLRIRSTDRDGVLMNDLRRYLKQLWRSYGLRVVSAVQLANHAGNNDYPPGYDAVADLE